MVLACLLAAAVALRTGKIIQIFATNRYIKLCI